MMPLRNPMTLGTCAGPAINLAGLVLATLPTARKVFADAVRHGESVELARYAALITSPVSIPTMMGIALVFG